MTLDKIIENFSRNTPADKLDHSRDVVDRALVELKQLTGSFGKQFEENFEGWLNRRSSQHSQLIRPTRR